MALVHVQPYFPEPIEVEGNAAALPYDDRLRFVRRLWVSHGATVAFAIGVGLLIPVEFPWQALAWIAAGALVALSATRLVAKGGKAERPLVWALLPVLLAALGGLVREASTAGFPAWTLGVASACALAYSILSGRDFSFVGQFWLSAAGCAGLLLGFAWFEGLAFTEAWSGLVLAWGYLGYLVYDAAALLSRRRPDELVEAVADLYRDALNFLTYSVRVWRHWRKYRY